MKGNKKENVKKVKDNTVKFIEKHGVAIVGGTIAGIACYVCYRKGQMDILNSGDIKLFTALCKDDKLTGIMAFFKK